MYTLTYLALFFFAIGIHTSVSIPAGLHIFGAIPALYFGFKQKHLWKKLPLSAWALLIFCFIFALSSALNFSSLQEIGKSISSIKYWLFGMMFIFPLNFFLQQYQLKSLRILINLLLISVSLAAIIGTIRSKFHFDPLTLKPRFYHERIGGFYDYMRYAYNLQFIIVFMTGLLLFKKETSAFYNRKLLIVSYIFAWGGLFLSQTRGALVATIIGIIAVLFFKNKKTGIISAITGCILGLLALSIVLSGGNESIRVLEKYNSSSNTTRISQFKSAVYAFKEKPILGFGPSQLKFNVERIKNQYNIEHKDYVGQHAHNIFLEILADFGFLGLIAFLIWLALWGKELLFTSWITMHLLFPCFLTLLVSGQVEYLFSSTGSFTIMFLYSLSSAFYLQKIEV